MRKPATVLVACVASVLLIAAGAEKPTRTQDAQTTTTPEAVTARQPQQVGAVRTLPQRNDADSREDLTAAVQGVEQLPTTARAAAYQIKWSSINAGGAIGAGSANYKMGLSVGQSVAGTGSSAHYKAGIGFWYGASGGGGTACAVTATGDVNLTGTLTSADIIFLVNFVFKGGPTPSPCEAAGDVNCTGTVTSADIIYLVNHVFKGGAAPCDVCSLIPATWTCP